MANAITQEEARLYAMHIAAGHAYTDRVIGNKEFDCRLTRSEFALPIENALVNPTQPKSLRHGRRGFWSRPEGMIVVLDPGNPDGGTAYVTE